MLSRCSISNNKKSTFVSQGSGILDSNYMLTSDFNTKSIELENEIKDAEIIVKSAVTKANSIKSNLNDYVKKTDVANDITTIKK